MSCFSRETPRKKTYKRLWLHNKYIFAHQITVVDVKWKPILRYKQSLRDAIITFQWNGYKAVIFFILQQLERMHIWVSGGIAGDACLLCVDT